MRSPKSNLRRRFWVEAGLAGLAGALFVLTLLWHDWLETLGFDPDNHSGSAEWLIVAVLFVLFAVSGLSARMEWRRGALAH